MAPLTPDDVLVWHDRSTAEHQALRAEAEASGLWPASLSLYGPPSDPRWAAVMLPRDDGLEPRSVGPVTMGELESELAAMEATGWSPSIVTATGPAGAAVFAAVFLPFASDREVRLAVSAAEFEADHDAVQIAGRIPLWIDAYGAPDDVRYAVILGQNRADQAWSCDGRDEDPDAFAARYDALTSCWCRPELLSVTPSGGTLSMFVDSTIGRTHARTALSSDELVNAVHEAAADGEVPIRLAGGASGATRFAVVFGTRDDIDERVFRAIGPVTLQGVDDAMEDFLRSNRIRGAALAVVDGTELHYAKGYTLAEPDPTYPDVLPTTRFRLASVSKSFAAVAMWRLLQASSTTTLATTMQSVLGLEKPTDERFEDITIQHLLESRSGIPQGLVFQSRDIVKFAGTNLPATPLELLRFAAAQTLTGEPGSTTNVVYGNTDYFLLSQVIAALVGAPSFEAALHELVLAPLGMVRTRGSRTLVEVQPEDEARYHVAVHDGGARPFTIGKSVMHPDERLVPVQYGMEPRELVDGCGGLSSAVVDVARLVAMFSARIANPVLSADTIDELFAAAAAAAAGLSGPDPHGYHGFDRTITFNGPGNASADKGGLIAGTQSIIQVQTGGRSHVILWNGRTRGGTAWDAYKVPLAAAGLGTADLFPQFGMASFGAASPVGPGPMGDQPAPPVPAARPVVPPAERRTARRRA